MFAQIQALNLSNTFSKIMNLGKHFFYFLLLGHGMKAPGNIYIYIYIFFFWDGPQFKPKLWHSWQAPRARGYPTDRVWS